MGYKKYMLMWILMSFMLTVEVKIVTVCKKGSEYDKFVENKSLKYYSLWRKKMKTPVYQVWGNVINKAF